MLVTIARTRVANRANSEIIGRVHWLSCFLCATGFASTWSDEQAHLTELHPNNMGDDRPGSQGHPNTASLTLH